MKIFLSFHYDPQNQGQEQFVFRVSYYLRKQDDMEPYCYTGDSNDDQWRNSVGRAVMKCDKFVLFVGREIGQAQITEAKAFLREHEKTIGNDALSVFFKNACALPNEFFQFNSGIRVNQSLYDLGRDDLTDNQEDAFESEAQRCAREILKHILSQSTSDRQRWIPADGLPIGYPFGYEKKIIKEFIKGNGRLLSPKYLADGCPIKWPKIKKMGTPNCPNPIPVSEIGDYRQYANCIIVDVMGRNHDGLGTGGCCLAARKLTFPEAGPRENLLYADNRNNLTVGIVVSGGIAPGINAVIAGIVQRHSLYDRGIPSNLNIYMYRDGFEGIRTRRKFELRESMLMDQSTLGGSMINTSRYDELLEVKNRGKREGLLTEVVRHLEHDQIDILYVIGGDGSMRAAHAIWTRAQEMFRSDDPNRKIHKQVSVVAIPKTMDNDVLWVWQSFGFLSAVEKAKDFIVQLNTEAKSNPRLCIVQLFGSDSGFVVSHAALASGACMAALIPEVNFTMRKLSAYITEKMKMKYRDRDIQNNGQSPYGLVLLGETAIPQDVEHYIDNPSYPDLGLEEEEKEAIRRFMGSSLLCREDIRNWQGLADAIYNSPEGSPGKRILDFMPIEVKAILGHASDLGSSSSRLLVLSAINQMLKQEEFFGRKYFRDIAFTTELREVEDILQHVKEMTGTKGATCYMGEDIKSLVQKLMTVPISCEAREIVNLLEKKSHLETHSWTDIPTRDDNLTLLQRLRQRLIEKFNRLLLEVVFSDDIIATGPSIQKNRRVQGQTPDELRSGGLKIVSRVLKQDIQNLDDPDRYWHKYRVFVNEPRHLIRAIAPSVSDVIFGQRLGILAVDNAMAGYTDFMVSQWLTEYVMVPLKLTVLGRKRVPHNGIFWKSVLAGTGQAPDMI
ncbi:MAG: 6-phosphofructokinase [Proteobacteria bacterium]|nr:6-phosphofructokinase [Pseudomonadota bacterium]